MQLAITGVGAVTALGRGASALFEGLCRGDRPLETAPRWQDRGPTAVPGEPGGQTTTALALEAVVEALADYPDPSELSVVGATTSADMHRAEPAWQARARGQALADPSAFIWPQLCHVPTQGVARAIGARGLRLSLSTACTSGANAIAVAADLIRAGRAPAAVAFGADAVCLTTVHGFGALGLYDPEPCRPFAPDRAGLNIGEGAAALLIEPLERALSRGAGPIALLAGFGNSSDGYRFTAPEPSGARAEAAIRTALGSLPPDTVGYVNAHGTGTPLNDETEAALLQRVFPGAWVSGLKGAIGHTLGAAGAVEAVVTALALYHGRVPPHPGPDQNAFPALKLAREPMDLDLEAALSVNFAFGGNNTAILLRRWRQP